MISNETVRSMDTADGMEISVSIYRDTVVLTDSTVIPYRSLHFTPAEARILAEFLCEQAYEAEQANA